MRPLPRSRSCFACGRRNPHGLHLSFETDGTVVSTAWTPQPHHSGFIDTVHGGVLATVLDEIMAWTCGAVGGRFAYSVEIGLRFSNPLRPGTPTRGTGRIRESRGSRIFRAEATLVAAAGEIASAKGTYLAIPRKEEARLRDELDEEERELWERMRQEGSGDCQAGGSLPP